MDILDTKRMFNDVMNEFKSKYQSIKEEIDINYSYEIYKFGLIIPNFKYFNFFHFFKIPIRLLKINPNYSDELIIAKYESLNCINHFNNYMYDTKYKKFYHKNDTINREYGGGISLCAFYSIYYQNSVNPKLINKIFQANGLNFGMGEIYVNG